MKIQGDVEVESCFKIIYLFTEVSALSVACDVAWEEEDEGEYCQSVSRTLLSKRDVNEGTPSHSLLSSLP